MEVLHAADLPPLDANGEAARGRQGAVLEGCWRAAGWQRSRPAPGPVPQA